MTPRLYDLSTTWHIPASTQAVWEVLADPDMSWPAWWPGCSLAAPLERMAGQGSGRPADRGPTPPSSAAALPTREELLLSTTAHLDFRAPLGYTLTVAITPTLVNSPHRIEFDAAGHLDGTGSVQLRPSAGEACPEPGCAGSATDVFISWRVRPTKLWMTALSPMAAPVFTAAHTVMMRRGELGLAAILSTSH